MPSPNFSLDNVLSAPGSTLAGAGLFFSALSSVVTGPLPETTAGWLVLAVQAVAAVAAAFAR